jgi:hypothetical protein
VGRLNVRIRSLVLVMVLALSASSLAGCAASSDTVLDADYQKCDQQFPGRSLSEQQANDRCRTAARDRAKARKPAEANAGGGGGSSSTFKEKVCGPFSNPPKDQCVTPTTKRLVDAAMAAGFPKPSCWARGQFDHPKGKACDWMMTYDGSAARGARKALGDNLANWGVSNARRLNIHYIIWYGRIWNPQQGWHKYIPPKGEGPHTNHVHISVN